MCYSLLSLFLRGCPNTMATPISTPISPRGVSATLHQWEWFYPIGCKYGGMRSSPQGTQGIICATCADGWIDSLGPTDSGQLPSKCLPAYCSRFDHPQVDATEGEWALYSTGRSTRGALTSATSRMLPATSLPRDSPMCSRLVRGRSRGWACPRARESSWPLWRRWGRTAWGWPRPQLSGHWWTVYLYLPLRFRHECKLDETDLGFQMCIWCGHNNFVPFCMPWVFCEVHLLMFAHTV